MRSEEDIKYLAYKHKGGEANAKGSFYEDYYAIFQIVSCIAKYKSELGSIAFQTQLEDTFVDDLLIAHPDKHVYHQIKNTKVLTWNTKPSSRTIASDFENQIRDCKERDESFTLKLVYSAAESNVKDTIPEAIKDYTTVEFFQYQEDLNSMVLSDLEFQNALRKVSAKGDFSTIDELAIIATVFYGAWKKNGSKKSVSLAEIVGQAEQQKYFNLSIYPDGIINEDCRKILDGIKGLVYSVRGRMFEWRISNFSGSCPWSEDIEKLIIENQPTTRRELVILL